MPRKLNVIKNRYTRLIVIKEVQKHISTGGNASSQYLCQCDCGNEKIIFLRSLVSGKTKSCGCLLRESCSINGKKRRIHGMRSKESEGDKTYESWRAMRRRCLTNNTRYKLRGIKICKRWNSFNNFLHDMGPRPPGKTIDRINNDGNYEPSNCRWATPKEQANNRQNNRLAIKRGWVARRINTN